MGTSVNQPSPNTPSWRLARALLGRSDTPAERQVAELWRAATADRSQALQRELADPILARAVEIAAASAGTAHDALERFDQVVYESRSNNFALELGRRALARAVLNGTGPGGFAAGLFSEATAYYVSRDLPGFVGSPSRVNTAHQALALKSELQGLTYRLASAQTPTASAEGWARFVESTVALLTGRGRAS